MITASLMIKVNSIFPNHGYDTGVHLIPDRASHHRQEIRLVRNRVPVQILIDAPTAELPCYRSLALGPIITPVAAGFLIHVAWFRSEYQAMRDDGFSHLTLS